MVTDKSKQNQFPPGLDEKKVHEIIAYYDSQTEEEVIAEIEAAFDNQTLTEIPKSRKSSPRKTRRI